MSLIDQVGGGYRVKGAVALPNTAVTQTSNTAASTQDGLTIDRLTLGRRYYSCKTIVAAAWGAGSSQQTVSLSLNFQHSSDGTSWDNFSTGTVVASVLGSTSTGGSTGTTGAATYGTVEQSVGLVGARRYVRMQLPVPTFGDCSSGKTVTVAGTIVFMGADELPAV